MKHQFSKQISFGAVSLTLVDSSHGYADYDVEGHAQGIRRVKICPDLKPGEMFNAYFGNSSKAGVVWLGTIEKSLHENCLPDFGHDETEITATVAIA